MEPTEAIGAIALVIGILLWAAALNMKYGLL